VARTGTVWINDFDEGIQRTLGGELTDYEVDGGARKRFAIDFQHFPIRLLRNGDFEYRDFGVRGPEVYGHRVPVFFVAGSPPFNPKIYPAIVIRRTSLDVALENGGQAYGVEYSTRAEGSQEISVTLPDQSVVTGYSKLEVKPPATPYNIGYDISIRGRGDSAQQQVNLMYKALSRIIEPKGFTLKLTDDLGDERGYDAFLEGVSPITEVLDLTGRDAGWTLTVIVHGEMDHVEPYDVPAVTSLPNIGL
jgi:hypothetical protein